MNFLNDMLAQWGNGQTPWAQEQMARMAGNGMPQEPVAQSGGEGGMMAGAMPRSPTPIPLPMREPMMAGKSGAEGMSRRPPAAVFSGPEAVTSPSLATYASGALRGASQASNPLGAILGAVGGAMGAREDVDQRNQTYKLLVSKGVDPNDAALAIKAGPQAMQMVLQEAFGKGKGNEPMTLNPGQKVFDPRTGKVLLDNSESTKPTSDISEYNLAKQQGYGGTFRDFQLELKRAGATAITVDQKGENAFTKKAAEMEANKYESIVKGASTARENMANLDALEGALNSYQEGSMFGSGSFGPAETSARAAALALGIGNADTVGAAQLAESIRNKLTLAARSTADGAGMPGALSDADRNFLLATTAGLDKTAVGNQKIIELNRLLEKRRMDVAQLASTYVEQNGRLDSKFDTMLAEWAKAHPLRPGAASPMTQPKMTFPLDPAAAGPQTPAPASNLRAKYGLE